MPAARPYLRESMGVRMSDYIVPVDEYPIPIGREKIIDMQVESVEGDYGLLSYSEVVLTVDEFRERYVHEMVRTDEWSVFKYLWRHGTWIYFWNHQLGYGFKVNSDWEIMCPFVELMQEFADEYDPEDFEPNRYPWQLP